ncbi:hypothetical protein [Neobacillus mesonae]|nr:hypothetical protein [Neobacillus mesonae]MCM3569601.1 hypothetical protein [Neobacillus mesonae]
MGIDPNQQTKYEFDEQGANMVSEQIMESYNSGHIDHEMTSDEEESSF